MNILKSLAVKNIEEATREVRELLESRADLLEAIARRLIEKEVIDSRELAQILGEHAAAVPQAGRGAIPKGSDDADHHVVARM